MKSQSKKTDINKGQEVPSINLNPQRKAAQYLVQQVQTKEGGGGARNTNKYRFFLIFFYKCKRKLPTKKSMQIIRTKQKEFCYTTTKQTLECSKVSINPTWKEGLHKKTSQLFWQGEVNQQNKKETNTKKLLKIKPKSRTEDDQKHKPKIVPSKGGKGEEKRTNQML